LQLGCGDEEEEEAVAAPRPSLKANTGDAPAEAATPAADEAERLGYSYDAVNRRDPFKTYFDELILEEQEQESLTELQRFELDKLKLIAVVVGTATPMAMVMDPTGKGHTVRIGTLIGKRFGQIKHIRRGEIVVQEEFRDFTGKRIPVLKPLKLEEETTGL
ncbi:MAG: pilus assembly protein PilP, partial [Myxococcota bacterium]